MRSAPFIGLAVAALCLGPTVLAAPDPSSARESIATRLARRFTVEASSRSLREVIQTVEQAAGVRIQALYADDRHDTGLDPGIEITLSAKEEPLATILARLAESAADDATWQLSPSGSIQLGPRSRLNAFKRTHIYDIRDLLHIAPDHHSGPSIDLQQALQARGSSSPITDSDDDTLIEQPSTPERIAELATLIRDLIEPEQWADNGGDAATLRIFRSSLIITAPDYIHRAMQQH